ncbi:MAG: helix-turn-helix domain-containing protein [Desulfarculaceae bacterium]|jgi:DNA-binding IclR family transcriptional regulator
MSKPKDTINSVVKACTLLREAADRGAFTTSEMAFTLELPPSTVDRLIRTLAAEGFLERRGNLWRLGPTARGLWAAGVKALRKEQSEIAQELGRLTVNQ